MNKVFLAGGMFLAVAGAAFAGGAKVAAKEAAAEAQSAAPALIQTVGQGGDDGLERYIAYINAEKALKQEFNEKTGELAGLENEEIFSAAEKLLGDDYEILMTDLAVLNSEYNACEAAGLEIRDGLIDEANVIMGQIKAMTHKSAAFKDAAEKVRVKFAAGYDALNIQWNYSLAELKAEYKF